ncbi:MAG: hypothetical protein V2A72_03445 [Candidatus Omnitrophota bacterium]
MNDSQINILSLTGGEVFLNDDMIDRLIKIIKQTKIQFFIVATNGLWAKDPERAQQVLEKISKAFSDRKLDFFFMVDFSVDQWHSRGALEGIANVINIYTDKSVKRLDNSSFGIKFTTCNNNNEETIKLFKEINSKLKDGHLKIGDLSKTLEEDLSSSHGQTTGVISFVSSVPPTPKLYNSHEFIFEILPVRAQERAKMLPIKKLYALLRVNFRYGVADTAGQKTKLSMFIDSDGSVRLDCGNKLSNSAFISGNIAEGFFVLTDREKRDPLFKFIREKGSLGAVEMLEIIEPKCLKDIAYNIDPYDVLDEILSADENLRIRLTLAILHQYYWYHLTEESQKKVIEFEDKERIEIVKGASIPEAKRLLEELSLHRKIAAGDDIVNLLDNYDPRGQQQFVQYFASSALRPMAEAN